jgi:hypothetical protein
MTRENIHHGDAEARRMIKYAVHAAAEGFDDSLPFQN